jgi:hypothetical protein
MKVKGKLEEQASVTKTVRVLTCPSSQGMNKNIISPLQKFEINIRALKHKMETNSDCIRIWICAVPCHVHSSHACISNVAQ